MVTDDATFHGLSLQLHPHLRFPGLGTLNLGPVASQSSSFSNELSCKIVQHVGSILPGLLMHRTPGKQGLATLGLWVASLHVGTSGYEQMDRSAPYSVLSNLISCLRRKKLLGMAGRKHSVKRSFALDGTVSGTCHRGDTADGVSSRLTWTVGNMRLRSFLRTVTTLRVEL